MTMTDHATRAMEVVGTWIAHWNQANRRLLASDDVQADLIDRIARRYTEIAEEVRASERARLHQVIDQARNIINPETHPDWEERAAAELVACDERHEEHVATARREAWRAGAAAMRDSIVAACEAIEGRGNRRLISAGAVRSIALPDDPPA